MLKAAKYVEVADIFSYKEISNTKPTSSTLDFDMSSKNGNKSSNSLSCVSLNQLEIGMEC
ncbi:unnamed protein product [Debaryomyces fabryi]|nr:unnamed protein product [Debaryomyces fabryi]